MKYYPDQYINIALSQNEFPALRLRTDCKSVKR